MRQPVEVWVETTKRWVGGFELCEQLEDGSVVVARDGDSPLPVALPAERVRPERSSGHRSVAVGEAAGRHGGRPLGRRW